MDNGLRLALDRLKTEARCFEETTIPAFEENLDWLDRYQAELALQGIHENPRELLTKDPAAALRTAKTRARQIGFATRGVVDGTYANPAKFIARNRESIKHYTRRLHELEQEIGEVHEKIEDSYDLPAHLAYTASFGYIS